MLDKGKVVSENKQHIVIVEDDKRLNQMMTDLLNNENYQTSSIYDGISAISTINSQLPDIVLLDMMLPSCDGLEILRNIDKQFNGIIIMITAKKDDFLEVSALNLGVHDFITKPLRPHILLARLKALSRLNKNNDSQYNQMEQSTIKAQDLTLDTNSRELWLADNFVNISSAEYDILLYFMRNPARILSREMIIKALRKIDYDGLDRSIDMRISSLRKKLQDTCPPYKYIKTVRAKGYILAK
jgi:DNA-binding response OmpR family regulator